MQDILIISTFLQYILSLSSLCFSLPRLLKMIVSILADTRHLLPSVGRWCVGYLSSCSRPSSTQQVCLTAWTGPWCLWVLWCAFEMNWNWNDTLHYIPEDTSVSSCLIGSGCKRHRLAISAMRIDNEVKSENLFPATQMCAFIITEGLSVPTLNFREYQIFFRLYDVSCLGFYLLSHFHTAVLTLKWFPCLCWSWLQERWMRVNLYLKPAFHSPHFFLISPSSPSFHPERALKRCVYPLAACIQIINPKQLLSSFICLSAR